MSSNWTDWQHEWQEARQTASVEAPNANEIIERATRKQRSTVFFHYGNLVALSLLLIVIWYVFAYWLPFRELLSKIGVALMLGSLALRVCIEAFSVVKLRKITPGDSTLKNLNDTLAFYHFRRRVHGPVTLVIVGLYTIGFYLLTPEFAKHLELWLVVLIDISYVLSTIIPIWQIRKSIKREMQNLSDMLELKESLLEVTKLEKE